MLYHVKVKHCSRVIVLPFASFSETRGMKASVHKGCWLERLKGIYHLIAPTGRIPSDLRGRSGILTRVPGLGQGFTTWYYACTPNKKAIRSERFGTMISGCACILIFSRCEVFKKKKNLVRVETSTDDQRLCTLRGRASLVYSREI